MASSSSDETGGPIAYRLCPTCGRAVPAALDERFCPNDGTPLIGTCPGCHHPILSPYARHCTRCGRALLRPQGVS